MNTWRTGRRNGTTLIEMGACMTVLIVATALTTQMVVLLLAQTRELNRRSTAVREADNAMERIMATRPEIWESATASPAGLSQSALATLPAGTIAVEVAPEVDGLKKLTIEVRWERKPGEAARPVRLTTWGAVQ